MDKVFRLADGSNCFGYIRTDAEIGAVEKAIISIRNKYDDYNTDDLPAELSEMGFSAVLIDIDDIFF